MSMDKESFLIMLEQHQGLLFKVCRTYCRDPEDIKDLVQEVIIQLWNNFDKYHGGVKLSTWIYRIALNVSISFYRKTTTRIKHESAFAEYASDMQAPGEEDERVPQLMQLINRLDEMNKALMILYLDGNSHEEIAEVLNISVSNVGTKISRLKQELKNQFKN